MIFCPKCGKENNEEAKFCQYCGTKLTNLENKKPAQKKPQAEKIWIDKCPVCGNGQ